MKEIKWEGSIKIYDSAQQLDNKQWQALCASASTAMKSAHAPYSKYQVGAALLLKDGTITTGSNQENAVYPLGVCAERVVLLHTNANYPDTAPSAIAIATHRNPEQSRFPAFPCGSCRQTLVEVEQRYQQKITILLTDNTGEVYVIESVEDILPFIFGSDRL